MSNEKVNSNFNDDSNDSKFDHHESSDWQKAETSQLTLIKPDYNEEESQLSEDHLINESSPPPDDFEENFHLSDLPPIDYPLLHAPMPSDIVMHAPILSNEVVEAHVPVVSDEVRLSENESFPFLVSDNCESSDALLTDDIEKDNYESKSIPPNDIENIETKTIYHSTEIVEEKVDFKVKEVNQNLPFDNTQCIDKYTDKNSNCITRSDIEKQIHTKEQTYINTSDTKITDNVIIESMQPLKRCESIPIFIENGTHVPDGKRWNAIYRLSLRLPQRLPLQSEIPNADSHSQYSKAGYLLKLIGRGFPYLNQWKRRYCILTKGCLYLYEKETSKGTEKNSSVLDFKYFDHVAEAMQKETKKASNVFVVTSQDRSFFDPGRHLFAADTLTEMHDWITKLRESIELIRNNNRPTTKGVKGLKRDIQDQGTNREENQLQQQSEQQKQLSKSKSSPLEDAVDTGVYILEENNREELILNLQRKIQRESEYRESKREKSSEELRERDHDTENYTQQGSSGKKSSGTTIFLQNPNLRVDATRLESITKNRIRGPAGRRAPQARRTILMKQRACSMSALEHDGQLDDEARDDGFVHNQHDGHVEEDRVLIDSGSLNSSQPILAYHYSSDEDSMEEDQMGSNRSIGKSSRGQIYSSKATSFTINEVPHHPVKGLRVYVNKDSSASSSGRYSRPRQDPDVEELLEYRSLPRSLARASKNGKTLAMRALSKGMQVSTSSGVRGSGRVSSGRASPEMDALDNMFMKRSVHSSVTDQHEDCPSDHEGSETSTFKGTPDDQDNKKCSTIDSEQLAKALERFSSTLQHLQHHTIELDNRTKQIESEFNISRNDVVNMQAATEGIRQEVKKLSETVTNVAQETSKAKKEYVSQRQETEKLQQDAAEALSQARRSQREFEKSKQEYELTIKDLHGLIASIRSSLVVTSPEESKPVKRVSLAETGKSLSENDKLEINKEGKEAVEYRKPVVDGKKTPSKDLSQKGGYQSFFQRPSSLIYGLTNRSLNKSPKKDRDDKDNQTSKSDKEEKRKSGKFSSDKKQKGEKQNQNSLEKKGKGTKSDEYHNTKDDEKHHLKHKGTTTDKNVKRDDNSNLKKCIPSFSIENFPMMDDFSDSLERRSGNTTGISHVSINVGHASQNFNLEKSLSSPTVTSKFSNKPRPHTLSIPPALGENGKSYSNTSSPDSPTTPAGPFSFASNQVNLREQQIRTSETLFPCQPASFSSVTRQSSMPSYSEDKLVNRHRQGVFAIARQRSSPNLPIQKYNSGTIYPLQRQNSLGTVPEEGQLPRQISLLSVPEDRPIVDQTLPLSPAPSMVSFALSPSPSGERLDNLRDRSSARNSMELVTGSVVSGSLFQESYTRPLPPLSDFNIGESPLATSSIKRKNGKRKTCSETLIL